MKRLFVLCPVVIALFSSLVMTSCEKDDDDDVTKNEQFTEYHYWKAYPNSYIKMCDWRMSLRFIECKRVEGGNVSIQYVLTNTGFNKKMMLSFGLPLSAGHDNLGNTYKSNTQEIVGYIDGKYVNNSVEFLPNQAIKGSFILKNFDINATAVSVSMKVNIIQPQSEHLMYNNIEFVNLPLDCNPDTLVHM